jgi:hypothetical protein
LDLGPFISLVFITLVSAVVSVAGAFTAVSLAVISTVVFVAAVVTAAVVVTGGIAERSLAFNCAYALSICASRGRPSHSISTLPIERFAHFDAVWY